jgi:hypothetical protein
VAAIDTAIKTYAPKSAKTPQQIAEQNNFACQMVDASTPTPAPHTITAKQTNYAAKGRVQVPLTSANLARDKATVGTD